MRPICSCTYTSVTSFYICAEDEQRSFTQSHDGENSEGGSVHADHTEGSEDKYGDGGGDEPHRDVNPADLRLINQLQLDLEKAQAELRTQGDTTKKALEDKDKALADAREKNGKLEEENSKLKKKMAEWAKALEDKDKALADAREKNGKLEEENSKLKKKMAEWAKKIRELKDTTKYLKDTTKEMSDMLDVEQNLDLSK
ncbi:uveal autoantigen with coiled-coil domains and ankyrin repeats-like [Triticum aestivum]|uniref:uveal autoantigen with coiled-coil domains and ankyrin repeats-like n=1 Tax=Triticum aestivum TaxID=4565 RepID=UPI001D017CBC|nr:uveal autoantigen with coiled-coil domains and ankyrin repeats-like [Triticum aestivum]XP_044361584.1 uveal autoantigen with coiled-coil domains and ankyrin repeats-like [Triticum aestivum]XP_044445470.1 uveal autoantigen with coiled-coil domains and ankyrin repeats-like [Triticum aestivum]